MADQSRIQDWQAFFDERVRGRRDLVDGYLKYVKKLEETELPPIFELRHLAELVGIDEGVLVRIVQSPATFYREFEIPKRLGGSRNISVPSPTVLSAQRWILSEILSKLEIHSCCYGFVLGRSIVDNARAHLGTKTLLKLDIKDFFPSISFRQVMKIFLGAGYPVAVSYFLARICCLNKSLPQGAATSPSLSNLVARRLDMGLAKYTANSGLTYTRYADDLAISGEAIGSTEIAQIQYIVEEPVSYTHLRPTRPY